MNKYIIKDHIKTVPLDYQDIKGAQINLFAREVFLPANKSADVLVYLQGGPGFASPRDIETTPWLQEILKHFRLLLLDQRGTGRSQKVGPEINAIFPENDSLTDYLRHFRADNIVKDLEYLRQTCFKVKKWFLLGQSFGGFIACHYLSFYPQALCGVIICGGLPPISLQQPDALYARLVKNLHKRNMAFYKMYPRDIERVKKIANLLRRKPVDLGGSNRFTARRFLDMGLMLGCNDGFSQLHWLLDDPFTDTKERAISWQFAAKMSQQVSYELNPIYAIMHESIYCQEMASAWSAQRMLRKHGGFSLDNDKLCFHSETIQKHMFKDYEKLQNFNDVAFKLARHKKWPTLYDETQLAQNKVPVECIIYKDDLFVDYEYSLETLKAIRGAKAWVHPSWQHNSLRTHGDILLPKLFKRLLKRTGHTRGAL